MVLDIYLVPFHFPPRLLVLTLDIPNVPVLSDFGQSCLSNFAFQVSRDSPVSEFIWLSQKISIDQEQMEDEVDTQWWKDGMVRKSLLKECTRERCVDLLLNDCTWTMIVRFERLLVAFSTHVLLHEGYTHKMYPPSFASGHICLLSKSRSFRWLLRTYTMIYSFAAVNYLGAHGSIGQVHWTSGVENLTG